MVNKAVILCGGNATRFMPVCKAIPKEMLPIYNAPILHYLISDLITCGVKEITFVIRKGKECIKEYFTQNKKWEKIIKQTPSNEDFLKFKNIKFNFVYQKKQLGTGHALLCAKKFCNEPFFLLNGDELILNDISAFSQLKKEFLKHGCAVMGVKSVKKQEAYKYGMVKFEKTKQLFKLTEVVEKPKDFIYSKYLCNLGMFVFTPDIFKYICFNHANAQVPITDAINDYIKFNNMYIANIKGKRFDLGNPLSYALANIEFALNQPQLNKDVSKNLIKMLKD